MPDEQWQETFRARMRDFQRRRLTQPGAAALSVKVRVVSGCFHREHSPHAYALIDKLPVPPDVEIVEHESGPELLVFLAVGTAALSLAKSVIELITAIFRARAEGVKKGDRPADPLELIVRRGNDEQEYREEIILRLGHADQVDAKAIEGQIKRALQKLFKTNGPSDAVIMERARSFANEAMFTVALQRRRIRSSEPEDDVFVMRWWADLQFFIVALRRLRRAAEFAGRVATVKDSLAVALQNFDHALPQLMRMRNVGEHIDDYAVDSPRRHHKDVNRQALQVGTWDGTTYRWLGECLNVDLAHDVAQALFAAVSSAAKMWRSGIYVGPEQRDETVS